MDKKVVLIIDEDGDRAEKLLFLVRLGGYKTCAFSSAAAALNWVEYVCPRGDVLCLLLDPGQREVAEKVFVTWTAVGKIVPVLIVQRGNDDWNHHINIGEQDHFFVCTPGSVMQTLDILSCIKYTDSNADVCPEECADRGEVP